MTNATSNSIRFEELEARTFLSATAQAVAEARSAVNMLDLGTPVVMSAKFSDVVAGKDGADSGGGLDQFSKASQVRGLMDPTLGDIVGSGFGGFGKTAADLLDAAGASPANGSGKNIVSKQSLFSDDADGDVVTDSLGNKFDRKEIEDMAAEDKAEHDQNMAEAGSADDQRKDGFTDDEIAKTAAEQEEWGHGGLTSEADAQAEEAEERKWENGGITSKEEGDRLAKQQDKELQEQNARDTGITSEAQAKAMEEQMRKELAEIEAKKAAEKKKQEDSKKTPAPDAVDGRGVPQIVLTASGGSPTKSIATTRTAITLPNEGRQYTPVSISKDELFRGMIQKHTDGRSTPVPAEAVNTDLGDGGKGAHLPPGGTNPGDPTPTQDNSGGSSDSPEDPHHNN